MKRKSERNLEIAKLYQEGVPIKIIAHKFGIHGSNVSHIVHRQGIQRRYKSLPVKHKLTIYIESAVVEWFKTKYGKDHRKQIKKVLSDYVTVREIINADTTFGRTPQESNHELLRERH